MGERANALARAFSRKAAGMAPDLSGKGAGGRKQQVICVYVVYFCYRGIMATSLVHIRVDEKVKTKAAKELASMGLTVSDAVRMLLTRIAKEKALPFDVRTPNRETVAAMRDARAGKVKSFDSVEDLMADLNADD